MPLVNIMVNGRAYTIACDEGEEDHLRELATIVDAKAQEVAKSVGQVGDARLLLMAALLMADEHKAASEHDEVSGETAPESAVEALLRATRRVEDIAARLSTT
jgi:cell division protein ZapA